MLLQFRSFGRPVYRLGRPNSGGQKTLFKFSSFSCISTKKYVGMAINDFIMHLNISKWFRVQKCRQKRKTMTQRGRSERRNCQRNCSFNYLKVHASIRFFFYLNSLHCIWVSGAQILIISPLDANHGGFDVSTGLLKKLWMRYCVINCLHSTYKHVL